MNSFYDSLYGNVVHHRVSHTSTSLQQSAYTDMSDKHSIGFFIVQEATSAQDIEGLKLVQATDSSGTGKKALANAFLDDPALVDAAAGQVFVLEADAIAMDHENGFNFLAVEAAASATSNTLFITAFVVAYPRFLHEELNVITPSTDFKKVPAGGTAGS